MPMKQRLQNRRIIRPLLRLKNFLPFLLTSPCGILSFSYLQYRMLAGSEADGSEFPNDRTNATSLSRRRKTKCNGVRPRCNYCTAKNIGCEWPPNLNNAFIGSEPSTIPTWRVSLDASSSRSGAGNAPLSTAALERCLALFYEKHFAVDFCSFFRQSQFEATAPENHFLVTAIASLVTRYLTEDEVSSLLGFPSRAEAHRHFTKRAQSLARESSDRPSVPNIQGNLVLCLSAWLSDFGISHWMYAGTAIRMAQAMRLNKEYHDKHTEHEREIRRRTFWACLQFDRLLAFFLAKPHTLSLKNVAIALPSTDVAFAYGDPGRGITLITLAEYTGSASDLGVVPYLLKCLCLWSDMADFHVSQGRMSEPLPPTDAFSRFSMLSVSLKNWADALPAKLRWSQENYKVHSALDQGATFIALHCLLPSAWCVAHQDYLPHTDGSSVLLDYSDAAGWSFLHREPSLISTCVWKALAVGELVSETFYKHSRPDPPVNAAAIFVALAMFSAASPLLWLAYTADPQELGPNKDLALAYFEDFRRLLGGWSHTWKIARVWLKGLDEMRTLYEYAYRGDPGIMPSTLDDTDTEEGTGNPGDEELLNSWRPQPGDGLPQWNWPTNLYSFLHLNTASMGSLPSEQQKSLWAALMRGWPFSGDDSAFLDINGHMPLDS